MSVRLMAEIRTLLLLNGNLLDNIESWAIGTRFGFNDFWWNEEERAVQIQDLFFLIRSIHDCLVHDYCALLAGWQSKDGGPEVI